MNKTNPDIVRLEDIIKVIDDIFAFGDIDYDDRKTVMATTYGIAIIGEASNNISKELQEQYSNIPWRQIIGMRNRIIHSYGNVDVDQLQEVIEHFLLPLKQDIEKILKEISQ